MIVGQDSKGNAIMPKLDISKKRIIDNKKSSIIVADDIPYDLDDECLAKDFMNSAKIYDVPHLCSRDLKRILQEISRQYYETMNDELTMKTTMSEIKDDPVKNTQV